MKDEVASPETGHEAVSEDGQVILIAQELRDAGISVILGELRLSVASSPASKSYGPFVANRTRVEPALNAGHTPVRIEARTMFEPPPCPAPGETAIAPPDQTVAMPDLIGLPYDSAAEALLNLAAATGFTIAGLGQPPIQLAADRQPIVQSHEPAAGEQLAIYPLCPSCINGNEDPSRPEITLFFETTLSTPA